MLFAMLALISACGVKGDPLPPEKFPEKKQIIKMDTEDDTTKKVN